MMDDSETIWQAPPDGRRRNGKQKKFVKVLKSRPGEWAIYPCKRVSASALGSNFRKRVPGVEALVIDWILYVRWVGEDATKSELEKMRERFEMAAERNVELEAERDALSAEVRELRKDRERLDFVLEHYAIEIPNGAPVELPRWLECREDIDAAMSARGEEK